MDNVNVYLFAGLIRATNCGYHNGANVPPSYIRYMVCIKHPPLGGYCGTISLPKFSGGEIGGLLCPSLLLTITPNDFCCVTVYIYC